jgi:DNA-binding beta-propeller fold protein YncE
MWTRLLPPLVTVLLAACGALGSPGSGSGPGAERVLLLGSISGVTSIDPAGSVLFEGRGVAPLGDWSRIFSTTFDGGRTILEARYSATGQVLSTMAIPGELSVRVASPDLSRVALMPPLAAGASPWIPEPRASTTITVVDTSGAGQPEQFHLTGNFEPEAFSADGRRLFLIRYVPPTSPAAYRVAALDLSDGALSPVNTGQKGLEETMSGTRLEQIPSTDRTMLYTLYTTQPPEYVAGHSASGRHVAFVHTLSLAEGWAHCVGLPKPLWGGDPADQAMAISADGDRLFVVDTGRDMVAVMDTDTLEMTSTAAGLGLGPDQDFQTRAVIGPDGGLVVATGSRVATLDPSTLGVTGGWTTDAPVAALGSGPDGIYLAMPGVVQVVDPATGRELSAVRSPVVEGLAYVGSLDR